MSVGAKTWFSFFVLAVFCAGAGGGVLADRHLLHRGGRPPGGRGPSPLGPRESVDRLVGELQLSPEQRSAFDRLMSDRRSRLEQFYQDVQTRFETEQRELRHDINEMLTVEQRQRFDAWLRQQPPPPPGLFGGPPRGRQN